MLGEIGDYYTNIYAIMFAAKIKHRELLANWLIAKCYPREIKPFHRMCLLQTQSAGTVEHAIPALPSGAVIV
jgi:hypothetical protein